MSFEVIDEGGEVYLEARLPETFGGVRLGLVTGTDLPRVRIADADFEERDGAPPALAVDLLGKRKEPGPRLPRRPDRDPRPGRVPHPRLVIRINIGVWVGWITAA